VSASSPAAGCSLVQVVPPGEGGVVDHAGVLAGHWSAWGLANRIVRFDARDATATARSLHALRSALEEAARSGAPTATVAVVVHFSGYGYEPRGLCHGLVQAVEELRADWPVRWLVCFHELFASDRRPWRRAFWTARAQRQIATRLLRAADQSWTSNQAYAKALRGLAGACAAAPWVSPVFSNVGEPGLGSAPALCDRADTAVVFGSEASRARVAASLARCGLTERGVRVERVVEIGPGPSCDTAAGTGRAWERLGALPADQVLAQLLASRWLLVCDPPSMLAKSSVVAAGAAAGTVVLNLHGTDDGVAGNAAGDRCDGLRAGEQWIHRPPVSQLPVAAADLQTTANRLAHWYSRHRSDMHALRIVQWASARLQMP
jgi:hypothetical protein